MLSFLFVSLLLSLSFLLTDDSSSESASTNGLPSLAPPTGAAVVTAGISVTDGMVPYEEVTSNGTTAPLDFSTTSSSSSSEEGQQPLNLSDRLVPGVTPTLAPFPADPNRKHTIKTEYGNKVTVKTFFLITECSTYRPCIVSKCHITCCGTLWDFESTLHILHSDFSRRRSNN